MKTSTLTTQLYPSYAPPEKWRNESQTRRLQHGSAKTP